MKKLYNILNEGILDVDDVMNQLEDVAELGCLEKIFKLVGEFVDDQRQKDNRWQSAAQWGGGKSISYEPDQSKFQEFSKLIHQFIDIAARISISTEQSEVIRENPKEFIIGHVHEIQRRFKLELLIPQGSKFNLYSILTSEVGGDHIFDISILPINPSKPRKWLANIDTDVVNNMTSAKDGNFVIPYDKSMKKKIKGFLYNFDGFIRMKYY